jgi:hypothetical protein
LLPQFASAVCFRSSSFRSFLPQFELPQYEFPQFKLPQFASAVQAPTSRPFDITDACGHLGAAMILRLSAVCETARERPDGRLDLLGVFNELSAPGFPAAQDRMTVVFLVEWEPGEAGRQPLRADLIDDTGGKVLTIQGHTDVDPRDTDRAPAQTRLIMLLEKIVFQKPGRYLFQLVAGGDTTDACAFFVGQAPPPA